MIATVIVGLVGAVFLIFGYLIWKKEKISLLHEYHYNKVTEQNKKAFCALSGAGVFVMGIGLVITAVILELTDSPWSFMAFLLGFAAGLCLLICAGIRYNR